MSDGEDRVYHAPAKSKTKKAKDPWENISRGVKVSLGSSAKRLLGFVIGPFRTELESRWPALLALTVDSLARCRFFLQSNQYLLWPLAVAFGLIAVQTLVSGWLAALLAGAGGYYIYKRYQSRIVPPEVAEAAAKEQTAAAVRELGLDASEFEEDKEAAAKRKAADQEARRASRKAHEAALAAGAALEAASANKGSAAKAKGKGKAATGDEVDEDMLVHMASMVKAGSRSAARTIDTAKLLSPRSAASSGPASGKGGKDKEKGKAAAAAAAAAASESESDAAASAPAPSRSSGGARRRGKGGAAAGDEDGWTQQ